MEKPKEECKNQQQKKDYYNYGNLTLEELEEIIKDIFKEQSYKTKKDKMLFDPLYGRPIAKKQFDEALKKEYPHWFENLENNANNKR